MSVALVGPPAPLPLLPPPCPSFFFSIKEGKYIAFLKQLKEGLILAHGLRVQFIKALKSQGQEQLKAWPWKLEAACSHPEV